MRVAERARRVPLLRDVPFMPLLVPTLEPLLELSEFDPDVPLIPLELLMPLEFERLRSTSPPEVPDVLEVPPFCTFDPVDGMHVVDALIPLDEPVLLMPEADPLIPDEVVPLVLPIELLFP